MADRYDVNSLMTEEEYQATKPTAGKEIRKGLARGTDLMQANLLGGLAAYADSAGATNIRDAAEAGMQRNMAEAAQNPAAVSSTADIGQAYRDQGIGAAVDKTALWAAGGLSELAPQVGAYVVSNTIGRRIGGKGLGGKIVGGALTAGQNIAQETGSIYGDILEKTGQRESGTAMGYGAAAGAIDTVTDMIPMGKLLGEGLGAGNVVGDLAKAGAKQALIEAPTEAAQTVIERAAVTSIDPDQQVFNAEGRQEIVDAAALGALGGGVAGAGAEGIGRAGRAFLGGQDETPPTTPMADIPPQDPVQRHVSQQVQAAASLDPTAGPLSAAASMGAQTGAVARAAAEQIATNPAVAAKVAQEISIEDQQRMAASLNGYMPGAVQQPAQPQGIGAPARVVIEDREMPRRETVSDEAQVADLFRVQFDGGNMVTSAKVAAATGMPIEAVAKIRNLVLEERKPAQNAEEKPKATAPATSASPLEAEYPTMYLAKQALAGAGAESTHRVIGKGKAFAIEPISQQQEPTPTVKPSPAESQQPMAETVQPEPEQPAQAEAPQQERAGPIEVISDKAIRVNLPIEKIREAIGEKASVPKHKDGGYTVSRKHEAKIRAVLDGQDGEAARQQAVSAATDAAREAFASGGTEADASRAATSALIERMGDAPDISVAQEAPRAVKAAAQVDAAGKVDIVEMQHGVVRVRVNKADLDSGAEQLRTYTKAGKPAQGFVKRENLTNVNDDKLAESGSSQTKMQNTAGEADAGRTPEWTREMEGIAARLDEIGRPLQATTIRKIIEKDDGFPARIQLETAKETLAKFDNGQADELDAEMRSYERKAEEQSKPIEVRKAGDGAIAITIDPAATRAKQEAPGTRFNTEADRKAADKLDQILDSFTAGRNTPEGAARAAMRSVAEELRKPKTVVSVQAVLETAAQRLNKNLSAQADLVYEIAEQLGNHSDKATVKESLTDKAQENQPKRKPAQVIDNSELRPGEFIVRDGGTNLASFRIGADGQPAKIKHFFDSPQTRNHAMEAISAFVERESQQAKEQSKAQSHETAPDKDAVDKAGGTLMSVDDVAKNGDGAQSPWLMADGTIVGTNQDHLSFIDKYTKGKANNYSDFMRQTGAARVSFFIDKGGKYVASIHVANGQKLTDEQMATIRGIDARRSDPITVLFGSADGLVNPDYKETNLAGLHRFMSPVMGRPSTIDENKAAFEEGNKKRMQALHDNGWQVYRYTNNSGVEEVLDNVSHAQAKAVKDRQEKDPASKNIEFRIESFSAFDKETLLYRSKSGASERQVDARSSKAKTEPAKQSRFAGNKIFTEDKFEAARARLRSKLGQLNSGIDPEVLVDGMMMAGTYIEAGVRSFTQYSKAMIEDLGEGIKPYLLSFWEAARNYPGLNTEGMTSAEESLRIHQEQLAPEDKATPVVGKVAAKPAARGKKTGSRGDMVLTQDWGTDHIDGYGDSSRETGNDTKDAFLKETRNYLNAVADKLRTFGFEPHADRKGKEEKPVSVNESGMAGSGDVTLTMHNPDTDMKVYIHVGDTSLRGVVPVTPSGIAIMYRVGKGSDRYAGKAGNTWAPVDLSANDLAQLVIDSARANMDQKAGATTEEPTNANPEQRGRAADQGRAPEVSGRGGRDNGSAARADSGNLEGQQPQNVPATENTWRAGGNGVRVPDADVGGKGQVDFFGDAGNGRQGTSRARAPDAGAGERSSVRDPESISPANTGPGNFHIDNPLEIVGGGQVARFDKNRSAIELLSKIREESRQATAEEQRVLAGYTGWGSFGQELFQGTWDRPMPKSGWEARDTWLREHLGKDEWEAAQNSIINAHYTDPPTVMAMWDMAKRMGFTGGRVLEPSMGIGNFFGMMPLDIKTRSQLAGIELDDLTGSMAQLLYPDANIKIMGYQESKTPDNFYDVVIGNWPFANFSIADRRYNTLNPFIHDYFFLKAVDQVRPGGLVIGITSSGTMDKRETKIRAALAKKAELVSAIRLPSGAFEEYAGTKVVTDIIILKKRDQALSLTPDDPWINSVAYKTPSGEEVHVNEYYAKNPGNVIGTIDYGHGTTRGRAGMIVHRPENMADRLKEAVNMVPEGVFTRESVAQHISYITNHTADREGSLTAQDGQLYVVRGEHLAPAQEVRKYQVKSPQETAKREKQLQALIDMRRKYAALIEAERTGTAETQRTDLRKAFEDFEKEHGSLEDSFGLDYLSKIDDPFYPALAALSVNGKPAAILRESTMRGAVAIKNPTPQDAYVLARNRSLQPTLAEIASIAGKTEDQVRQALVKSGAVFEAPNGDIVPSDIYLSGNVRQKLREARAALEEGNKAMERNVAELEKVVPADIPYFNIESQLGATWVPAKAYAEYVAHMLNRPNANNIDVTFLNGRWKVRLPEGANNAPEAQTGFGTREYPFSKLVNAAFSNQTVKIKRKDSDGTEYVDNEATAEANARIGEIRGRFAEWLWSDPERRSELELEYNEVRNAYATPKYDGSFLSFEGMALSLGSGPFNLREHQANAIWRALVNRRSINAHEVGTGKTFTMGGIAVESRRYGIAKKPMILAHNANSASVAHEIQMMYPAAKVLYVDNLSKDTIAVKMRQIANDDWDAIVFPHSLLDRLSFREETLMAMAQDDIKALEEEAYAAAQEDGVEITPEMLTDDEELKKLRSVTAKELVKARNRIIETIRRQSQQSSREDFVPFEELGIDMVLVDEVHEFKKPPISTRMNMKGLNTQTSNRSISLQFITRYIRNNNFGGNVHTFTGTPITNTMTEIYHQMKYVMEDEMKAAGVDAWDGWFGSFAKEVQDVELSAAGEYETVNRLAGFINVPELRRMIGQYMDVVFAEDMPEMQPREVNGKKLTDPDLTEAERAQLLNGRTENAKDRPYKKVINVTSDLTPAQSSIFAELQGYARAWRNMTGKERKEAMAAGSPESPIITEGMANKASFDVRLTEDERWSGMEGQAPDDPGSKSSKVVANVLEVYNSDPRTAQVIFSEMGYSTSQKRSVGRNGAGEKMYRTVKTFSTMRDIVERLVQGGIPREQIAIVDGSTSKEKRKEIADAMNSLRIRVVIGSTDTLGVGVNMQRNLRAMHHMDAPYMPGELEQRNGRGLRQGNQWNTVLEYRYMTDRLDGRRWQILAIKQRFINAFMKANSDSRVIEGDAASDEESDILQSFSEAAGDPRILIRAKLQKNVESLQRAERMHTNGVADARRALREARQAIDWNRDVLNHMTKNNLPERVREMVSAQVDDFRMTVDGKKFDVRKDAEEAIENFLRNEMRLDRSWVPLGTYRDQPITARWLPLAERPEIVMNVDGQEFVSIGLRGLEQQIRNYPQRIGKVEANIAQREGSIGRLEEVANAPFGRSKDLESAQKRLKALERDIELNPVPPPAWLRSGAPMDSVAYRDGKEFVVTGHRWTGEGWFVLGQDAKGEMSIPYTEVTDAQGMPLYEEREFQPPEVIDKQESAQSPTEAPKMSRAGSKATAALNRANVRSVVNSVKAGWKNAPEIIVADTVAELPFDAPSDAAGAFWKGKVYMVSSNIRSRDHAEFVLLHEVLGHYGLAGVLGNRIKPALRALYHENKLVRDSADKFLRANDGATIELAVEEALSDMAGAQVLKLSGIQRLIAAIRNGLRAIGFKLALTNNDVMMLLHSAKAFVQKGGKRQAADGATMFSRSTAITKDQIRQEVSDFFGGKLTDAKPAILATVPLNYMKDFARDSMTAVPEYIEIKRKMDKSRDSLVNRYDERAQDWFKWHIRNKEASQKLMDLMHDSTIAGQDPSVDFVPSGNEKKDIAAKAEWGRLRARYLALPEKAQQLFARVRDDYTEQRRLMDKTIEENIKKAAVFAEARAEREYRQAVERIEEEGYTGDELDAAMVNAAAVRDKKISAAQAGAFSRVQILRKLFESAQVDAPYFPLFRDGDYFAAVYNPGGGGVREVRHFKTASEQTAFVREQKAAGFKVKFGRKSNRQDVAGAVDPRFVADVDQALIDLPDADAIRDQIYQRYLESLPDMSIRKSFIHRKKTPGYSNDALKAYGSRMFHGAYQIARTRYSLDLQDALERIEEQAKNAADPSNAQALANEMNKRHEWVMNPNNSAGSQWATTAAFVYYLGLSPVQFLLNASQTVMMGVPILGSDKSRGGFVEAARQIARASKDFIAGKGDARNVLKGDELKAMQEFYDLGLIDRTQTYDLAGIGENGSGYSAARTVAMAKIGWFFQKAEVYNREATALAAYRMARAAGVPHEMAVKEASEKTWESHFDYTSGNRARVMQGDWPRVFLVFRQYSINMLYRLFRDIRDSIAGESPAVKKQAQRQLGAMMGMYALFAGATGVPFYGLLMLAGKAFDDEDEDFEQEFKAGVVEFLGPTLGRMVLNGVPGTLANVDLSSRIGMGNLWFRDIDAQLEGKDRYWAFVQQVLGAVPSMGANIAGGIKTALEGNVWRGMEQASPAFMRSLMRSGRYFVEGGADTMGGDRMADTGYWDAIAQGLGFTPAHIAERYETNAAIRNIEDRLRDRRRMLLNEYAAAVKTGDGKEDALKEIQAFNKEYPAIAITLKSIHASLKARARRDAQTEDGLFTDRKMRDIRDRMEIGQ